MAYLNGPASGSDFGVVEVGNNIIINDGIISLAQDVGLTANVTFYGIHGTVLFQGSNQVVDHVTPSAGFGIGLSNVTTYGPTPAFTITNTGVTTLTAGTGISLSGSTGNITVSSTGTSVINTIGASNNYTATATDEYIGCTTSSAITITLPAGTEGRTFIIKDENGGSPKITVTGTGGEKIDGANTKGITIGYSSISLVFRAGSWHII